MPVKMLTGQSAIEYLMTYGWMLLVVAVVGGAIFSIAQSQSVESVSGFTGDDVIVDDFGVTSGDELELILRNADSNTVTVEEVRVSDESNTAEWVDEESIGVGDTGSVTLQDVGEGSGADTLDVEIIYSSGGLSDLQVEGSISGNFEVIEDSTALAADFSYDPDNPEPDETVSFDASGSSGNITSYDWVFDDGSTATGESVDHSFSDEDDYSVELTVEDEEGNTDSSESVVSVSSLDPASFDLTSDGDNSPVLEGENFEVNYSVENSGDESDSQDVELSVDGDQKNINTHTLDSGESESDTLVWSTEEGDNGDDIGYSVSSGDDSFSGSLTVDGGEVSSPSVGGEWSRVEPAGAEGGYDYFFNSSTTPYGTTYGGNSSVQYTNDGFFVMKYQAAQNSTDNNLPVSNGDAGWNLISFNDDSAQSGPSSYTACENLDDETSSFDVHLMTNREWMTVARQVAQRSDNWVDGDIGGSGDSKGLYQGNHDSLRDLDRAVDLSFRPNAAGEGEDGEVERTHNLSSGDQVWDLSGDIYQWVDAEEDGTALSNPNSSKIYEKAAENSTVSNGAGLGDSTGTFDDGRAVIRGGNYNVGDDAGVFYADSDFRDSSTAIYGFRCSAVPVS